MKHLIKYGPKGALGKKEKGKLKKRTVSQSTRYYVQSNLMDLNKEKHIEGRSKYGGEPHLLLKRIFYQKGKKGIKLSMEVKDNRKNRRPKLPESRKKGLK